MRWLDQRLKWQNLKQDTNMNILNKQESSMIWFPEVIFVNNNNVQRITRDDKSTIVVEKYGVGVANLFSDLHNAEIFKGGDNSIRYNQISSINLSCDFKLSTYPFDTQQCTIQLSVPRNHKDWVEVRAKSMMYTGQTELQQFSVDKSFQKNTRNNMNNESVAIFVMTFNRKISYNLIAVYLPTSTIFIISLLTLRVPIEHFEASIMVQLTSMLVMYTLFQAIAVSLPKVN